MPNGPYLPLETHPEDLRERSDLNGCRRLGFRIAAATQLAFSGLCDAFLLTVSGQLSKGQQELDGRTGQV